MAGDRDFLTFAISHFLGLPRELQRVLELAIEAGGDHPEVDCAVRQRLAVKFGAAMGDDVLASLYVLIDGSLIPTRHVDVFDCSKAVALNVDSLLIPIAVELRGGIARIR